MCCLVTEEGAECSIPSSLVRWSLLILTWQGLVCGVPVLLVQRVTVALALRFAAAGVRTDWLKMCGEGRMSAPPRVPCGRPPFV
jgi:hypothetical protein